jgi:phospho-N-acetylmuramoyl-pentapeptide-transferase
MIPVLFCVLPFAARQWEVVGCLFLAMLTGYLDDESERPWGEYFKGSLDLGVAFLTSLALCQGEPFPVWLPLLKGSVELSPWLFVPLSTVLLWVTINATNCSDGVDGLAGALTLLSLFYLGSLLYMVIGHVDMAAYLLVPHNPEGASWTVLVLTAAGALGGYLWHNAEPSRVLMGDAGSRFLGLLVGVAVVAAGNPFLVLVAAPVVLVNGGTGLVKIVLLRLLKKLGVDTRVPQNGAGSAAAETHVDNGRPQPWFVRALHRIRFPLHDHCRKNLEWSNAQVLMRFVLLQAFVTPILFVLLVKIR